MSNECAKTKCEWSRMLKVCLVSSSMRLGVPFIAPRQLGAVESILGRQFLPSVDWCTRQSGAPPDTVRCGFLPVLAQPTVEGLEPLAHRTLSGAHRTVRCPVQTVGLATRHARIARSTVGSADRWLTRQSGVHRTVRWILAVRRRRIPESGLFTRASLAHRTLSGAPRLSRVLAARAKSFPIVFSLILALRQIC
jgi:hypothetical protein